MAFFAGLLLFSTCTCLMFMLGASGQYDFDKGQRIYICCLAFGAFTGLVTCVVDFVVHNIISHIG